MESLRTVLHLADEVALGPLWAKTGGKMIDISRSGRRDRWSTAVLVLASASLIYLLAAPANTTRAGEPHGIWVYGAASSCELACKAMQRQAFRTGHYEPGLPAMHSHYNVCRATLRADRRYAGRPGFQHHEGGEGSRGRCKVYGVGPLIDFDCLCN